MRSGFKATIEKEYIKDEIMAPYWHGHDPHEAINNLFSEFKAKQRLLWDEKQQDPTENAVIIGIDYAQEVKVIKIDLENLWKLQKLRACWLINFDDFDWSYICADGQNFYEKMSQKATLDIKNYILNK